MDEVARLIYAGIRPDCANETVRWFKKRGDEEGLERYVQNVENKTVEVSCR